MTISRRNFLLGGVGAFALLLSPSQLFSLTARAQGEGSRKKPILVLVQLTGGNDGLNTVIPYSNGVYYDKRKTLAIKQAEVLKLTDTTGLHPSMTGLADLFKNGKLAVVEGVGYPTPNRSHFRSIEIWQTAEPDRIGKTGWLGRYLDLSESSKQCISMSAINVDPLLPKTLVANRVTVPSVNNVYEFRFKTDPRFPDDHKAQVEAFSDIYSSYESKNKYANLLKRAGIEANRASEDLLKVVRKYKSTVKYPGGKLGDGLKFISQMIVGGVNSTIYTVSLDGFDTHVNQARTQANLLKQLSEALTAFQTDLEAHDAADNVVTLVFSEFGRRVEENGGRGTDHGTAEPVFAMGKPVKGGIYGESPSLTSLDNGDLKYTVDFRTVYATILDRWLSADSSEILGRRFELLGLI